MEEIKQSPPEEKAFKLEPKHLVYAYLIIGIIHFLGHLMPSVYYQSTPQIFARTVIYLGGMILFIYLIAVSFRKKADFNPHIVLLGIFLVVVFCTIDIALFFYLEWSVDIRLDGMEMKI